MFSKAAIWVVVALVLFTLFKQFEGKSIGAGMASVPYSEFLEEVKAKHIKEATIDDANRTVTVTTDGKKIKSQLTIFDRGLVGDLVNNGIKFDNKPPEEPSFLSQVFISWFLCCC
jgi:cell division protease FtsH